MLSLLIPWMEWKPLYSNICGAVDLTFESLSGLLLVVILVCSGIDCVLLVLACNGVDFLWLEYIFLLWYLEIYLNPRLFPFSTVTEAYWSQEHAGCLYCACLWDCCSLPNAGSRNLLETEKGAETNHIQLQVWIRSMRSCVVVWRSTLLSGSIWCLDADLFVCPLHRCSVWVMPSIGSLRSYYSDGNENVTKQKDLTRKQRPCMGFKVWYISSMYSAKQQREMTKFKVFWRTWAHDGTFFNLCLNLNAVPTCSVTWIVRPFCRTI